MVNQSEQQQLKHSDYSLKPTQKNELERLLLLLSFKKRAGSKIEYDHSGSGVGRRHEYQRALATLIMICLDQSELFLHQYWRIEKRLTDISQIKFAIKERISCSDLAAAPATSSLIQCQSMRPS